MRQTLIILFIALLLLSGCGSGAKPAATSANPVKYSGFMELKAGQWVETVSKHDGQTIKTRTEVIENSPSVAKFQIITEIGGEETVAQFWLDRTKGKPTKYLIKSGGDVMCLDVSQMPEGSVPSDGGSYPADRQGITHGTYSTPTGKEVTVARFTTADGEAWVSSNVPFGLVKVVQEGRTVMSLYDFGTIGAKSRIEQSDIDSCEDAGLSDIRQDPKTEKGYEQEYDHEAYYESESSGQDEDTDYEAYSYDRNTGDDKNFNCAECEGMPPMAKSACLAACR
ncbi:hypothetical protein JW898_00150 [Candidatus Woesearchaeota archaeon]|nr:hypothetical protein [Candidatus Woesearchaeota archaeon]